MCLSMSNKSSAVAEMGNHGHNRHRSKRGGLLCTFRGGGESRRLLQYNVAWAKVYFHTKWHLHPSSRLATIDMGWILGVGLCPFYGGGRARYPPDTKSPGPKPTFIPCGILVHQAAWPQWTWAENWGCAPLGRGAGFHLTQCHLGWGLPPYQMVSWCIQPFGHNRHGPKVGGAVPIFCEGSWDPI